MRKIADTTVRRLSLYLRFLEEFEEQGIETVSSEALAGRGGTTSAQVRKDLSFFGSFGKRGLGYSVPELVESPAPDPRTRPALPGGDDRRRQDRQRAGAESRLPPARLRYRRDLRPRPGQDRPELDGLPVDDVARLESALGKSPADIAVLVTPPESAQARRRPARRPRGQGDPQFRAGPAHRARRT